MAANDSTFTERPDGGAGGATALCVLGMHRSGTSALARVINLLGVDLGERLLEPSVDNPKGFWEQPDIIEAHEELFDALGMSYDDFFPMPEGWINRPAAAGAYDRVMSVVRGQFSRSAIWGFKDPRTCRTLPVWRHVFKDVRADHRYVFVVRSPDEIARSLAVRDGYSYNKSLLLMLVYLCDAEGSTRDRPRIVVTYDELMSDWRATCERVAAGLGIAWPVAYDAVAGDVGEFLDPGLRHHSATSGSPSAGMMAADPVVRRWSEQLHGLFLRAAGGAPLDSKQIEAIYGEYRAELPRLGAWHETRSAARRSQKLEAWGKDLEQQNRLLLAENEQLKLKLAVAGVTAAPAGDDGVKLTTLDAAVRTSAPTAGGADDPTPTPRTPEEWAERVDRLTASNAALAAAAAEAAGRAAELAAARDRHAEALASLQTRVRQLELDRQWFERERDAARADLARSAAPQTLERLAWLESHAAALETAGRETAAGNAWLRAELEKAGAEVAHRGAEVERLRAWISELDGARAWLTGELDRTRAELAARDAATPAAAPAGAAGT